LKSYPTSDASSGWETDGFWLAGVQWLAQFIVNSRGRVSTEDLGVLLSLGGQMVHAAHQERAAAEAAANLIDGLRGKGGAS
jgi:hypothetical protein